MIPYRYVIYDICPSGRGCRNIREADGNTFLSQSFCLSGMIGCPVAMALNTKGQGVKIFVLYICRKPPFVL